MTQVSAPLVNEEFTDSQWRALFSDLDGVIGTPGGTDYALTLPGSGTTITVGLGTARVAGFLHQVTAGEPITSPAPTSAARTDIITVRYDPSDTVSPAPVQLTRVAGTEGGGIPTIDTTEPGIQELPLWQITRSPSQVLSAATVVDLRRWITWRIACRSTNRPTGKYGLEIVEVDTGVIRVWNGSAWKRRGTVNQHRLTGDITLTFVNGVANGQVLFTEAFTSTPYVNMWTAAITGNTPVVWSVISRSTTSFTYRAQPYNGGGINTSVAAGWLAEVL